jgi:hypothetical protein
MGSRMGPVGGNAMALSEKQRQKKVERRSKKRKQNQKSFSASLLLGSDAASYARFPLYECLAPSGLFDIGIGSLIVARDALDGNVALSSFLVDVYCLGVKDAMFTLVDKLEYERSIKDRFMESQPGQHYERVHGACAKKLIEGAVSYAEGWGFSPHRDYHKARKLFGDVDSMACPVKYTYGSNGKPFYIRGPSESHAKAQMIIERLHRLCGEGGYRYLISVGEGF